jgi:hypothetical protein
MDEKKFIAHLLELQIPYSTCAKVPQKSNIRGTKGKT